MHTIILSFVLACTWGASHAQQVYRCTDAAGKVQMSDRMCDNTAVDRARVIVRPNTLEASGERELRLREENLRLREQSGQDRPKTGGQYGRTQADLQGERSNSFECRQARRDLEVAASSITAQNSEIRRAAEQSMRSACGMREPDQVTIYQEAPRAPVRPRPAVAPPRQIIDSSSGRHYTPAAGGYFSPSGQFCANAAGGIMCPSGFVPVH